MAAPPLWCGRAAERPRLMHESTTSLGRRNALESPPSAGSAGSRKHSLNLTQPAPGEKSALQIDLYDELPSRHPPDCPPPARQLPLEIKVLPAVVPRPLCLKNLDPW